MLGLKRKILKTSVLDIFQVKTESLLCRLFNMGFAFPDIRYNVALIYIIPPQMKKVILLYTILGILLMPSDSQDVGAGTDLRNDLDSDMVNSLFAPQNQIFCRTPILKTDHVFHRVLVFS